MDFGWGGLFGLVWICLKDIFLLYDYIESYDYIIYVYYIYMYISVCVLELELDLDHVRPCIYHIVTPDPSITSACQMWQQLVLVHVFFQTGIYCFTSDRRMDARPPAGRNTSTKVQANFQSDGTATISASPNRMSFVSPGWWVKWRNPCNSFTVYHRSEVKGAWDGLSSMIQQLDQSFLCFQN